MRLRPSRPAVLTVLLGSFVGPTLGWGTARATLPAAATKATKATAAPTDAARALRLYGAGPRSVDNGERRPCTGLRPAGQQVLCVAQGASASGRGTANAPLASIAKAVADARNGDVVQVAGGPAATYRESVTIGIFETDCSNGGEARNVSILGGFDASFSARDARRFPTTVAGDGKLSPFVICVMGGRSVVDGFVIATGGRNRGIIGSAGGFSGEGGSLVVSNNVVSGNRPPVTIDDGVYGGGVVVHAYEAATVEVADNHVLRNESGRGSGITASAQFDTGKVGTLKILRNRVESNVSQGSHGGGMFVSGPAEIAHNVVIGNRITGREGGGGYGGGFISDQGRPVVAHHNVVTGNYAAAYGSGEFYDSDPDARVSFELVSANLCSPETRSAGVMVDIGEIGEAKAEFTNITVVGHRCAQASVGALAVQQGAVANVKKSILWGNPGAGGKPVDAGVDDTGRVTVQHSVTQQRIAGTGNSSNDPRFVNAAVGDYRSSAFPGHGAFAPGGLEPTR